MSTSSDPATEVESAIWRAVASASVQIPQIQSCVYYFPQGHLEHSSSSSSSAVSEGNYNINARNPFLLCKVISVRLLSHHASDQAFVKILLQPLNAWERRPDKINIGDDGESDVVSFAKVLTPSDANNGGGFSVPRFCADSIFPPLDFAANPPVQILRMTDTRQIPWDFRHIYRGTPLRHLLTTGWSKFVNAKRLVAGDSVVFMRKKCTNELFIGIRRAGRYGGNNIWDSGEASANSSTTGRALEAIENAAKGLAFEVVYYPRVGSPDFVVSAEKVESALRIRWSVGMRVKIAVETEDSSRVTWFQGTISAAALPDSGPWRGSPWRMLQVSWDEPEILLNMNRVSPWQVEHVLPASELHPAIPAPYKKFKALQEPELLTVGEPQFCFPMTELARSMVGYTNTSVLNISPFPASIQGARQDPICISHLSNSHIDNSHQTFTELLKNSMEQELSTVLNIGIPNSDKLSPCCSGSVHLASQHGLSSPKRVGANSFQLFGKTIQVPEPVEGGLNNNIISYTDGERKGMYIEGNVSNNSPHHSPKEPQL